MDMGQAMTQLINKLLIVVGECPQCGSDLFQWRQKMPNGEDRCGPTCMSCGHKELKKKQDYQTIEIYNESLKKRAINYFKYSSLVPDKSLFNESFETYKILDDETRIAFETAEKAVEMMIFDKPTHLVLTGKSGTGKSHLAMGTAWKVLQKSNYQKNILFVNYRELLEQLRFAMNDREVQKQIQGALIAELKTADLVVIDDIGAELGGNKATDSTRYNNDVLTGILEARQNMAMIVTTNLTAKELKNSYGERILSRILKNSQGFTVAMKSAVDQRIRGIN